VGQALPAVFRIHGRGRPFAFQVELVDPVKAFRDFNGAVAFIANADTVALLIGRQHLLDGKAPGLIEDQVEGLAVEFPEFFRFGQFLDLEKFVQNKVDVAAVGNLLGHGLFPFLFKIKKHLPRRARRSRRKLFRTQINTNKYEKENRSTMKRMKDMKG
jgi:hypothetical protein